MKRPWSTPGVTPDPRIVVETDWCIHENGAWPVDDSTGDIAWSLRRLRFKNLMNCIRFEIDHGLTWEWPPR